MGQHGGLVVSTAASQQNSSWFEAQGRSGPSLHVLLMIVWVFCRYSDFLPKFKNTYVELIGDSKIACSNGCQCVCNFIHMWSLEAQVSFVIESFDLNGTNLVKENKAKKCMHS